MFNQDGAILSVDEITLRPRFSETDALGHISNTTLPVWFEVGREGLFRRIHPAMTLEEWPLIVARFEVDLKSQMFLGHEVTIKTAIEKLGNSSLTVFQEAWQQGILAATGRTVLVYFDYSTQRSRPFTDSIRQRLADMLMSTSNEPFQ